MDGQYITANEKNMKRKPHRQERTCHFMHFFIFSAMMLCYRAAVILEKLRKPLLILKGHNLVFSMAQ